jgi:hypothetical protein
MPALVLALGLLLSASAPATAAAVTPSTPRVGVNGQRPRVEVAFVLDTTGSMGGLIEGAKRRIWTIARRIGEGRPRPDVRIALVAYRDVGDSYVTRVFDLTGDMDAVYAQLMSFQAEGGGDFPEHVSRALSDAVHRVSWSRGGALKMIFLVGDAPPHVDYQDGYDFRRHAREARQLGIGVETIQCGGDPNAASAWREIASLGDGHYAQIDGQGGMPVRVTPADAELARLNAELAATVVSAGTAREQAETARRLDARAKMSAPAAVEAAGYFAAADRLAEKDLVGRSGAEQKSELATMRKNPSSAPVALKGKTDAEALAYLQAQGQKRQQIQERIQVLQKQREEHLRQAASGQRDAFDEQVVEALRTRAAAKGIEYR